MLKKLKGIVTILLVLVTSLAFAQNFQFLNIDEGEEGEEEHQYHRSSQEAEDGCVPCYDTIRPLPFIKQVHDIGLIFPTWKPVVGRDSVSVVEGYTEPENGRPSVSEADLPIYHYTHDFCFNLVPDRAYRGMLSYDIKTKADGTKDTVRNKSMHIEWEIGIGQSNRGNPATKLNRQGKSFGFSTAGHERGDVIWNWPTRGDWVHVEGLRVWDRGHPPAGTEIHPMRLMAVRRGLPEKIKTDTAYKYATRIDIFASGDGGAFDNNRPDQPAFVKKVKMSSKDYVFTVKNTLPRPSPASTLNYSVTQQKGNSFTAAVQYTMNAKDGTITIKIPWKSAAVNDTAIFANTLYLWWDEGNGVHDTYKIDEVKVTLDALVFSRFHEALGKAEIRMFLDVGGHYLFLNDFVKAKDILKHGLGKTRKHKWKFTNTFTLFVPQGKEFRIFANGFEADGIDKLFGRLVDPNSACTPATKKLINKLMIDATPVGFGGCLDDPLGDAMHFHNMKEVSGKYADYVLRPGDSFHEDGCPCASFNSKNIYSISYRVERMP